MPGGTEMEIVGVFIPKNTVFNFCALAPIGGLSTSGLTKGELGKVTKAIFKEGDGATFLKAVYEQNDSSTV
jgi:hypothetical protein